jgi:hypothetical protein
MSLQIPEYNKVFTAFVKFAQKNMAADNEKAIASVNVRTNPLGDRKILSVKTAANDSVHNWTRGLDEWVVNDATRKVFKKAVADLFGGEAGIPQSVKKAMLLADYNQGKPLTARRIMAVKQAIDVYKGDMLPLKFNLAQARTMIEDARQRLSGVLNTAEIDEDNITFAAECLKDYGNGLPAKTVRVLANFIVSSAFDPNNPLDEDTIKNVAKDMKSWREFDFGDKRLARLSARFVQRQNDYLKLQLAKPDGYMANNPQIFTAFHGDANRGDWTICGTRFPQGSDPDAVLAKFLQVVKKPNARKVVSTLLNQGSLADMQTILVKGTAIDGDPADPHAREEYLCRIKGGELFVSRDRMRDNEKGIAKEQDVHYGLDISKDGKTATVTLSMDQNLNSQGTVYNEYNIGMATITQKITIDLTRDVPEVTGVTFSQVFSADVINTNPGKWWEAAKNRQQEPLEA